ncbi:MAG: class I SAM-dependent methyltransferase [Nibricoccus sp.]
MTATPQELSRIYHRRFEGTANYRNKVWQILTAFFFSRWVAASDHVLDLGCGYGEFINNITAAKKFGMDLNPDAPKHLNHDVEFLHQDCSQRWQVSEASLDVIFTSNFFEHLPDKESLNKTLREAWRCLKVGGRLIALGPNVKFLHGRYWDFYDHHIALTEASLGEAMEVEGYSLEIVIPRFLPFTMVNAPRYPLALVRLYLSAPFMWKLKGQQFLVVAKKI